MERVAIYVLVNAAMPGLVKIGLTTAGAHKHAAEISGRATVPADFDVVYEEEVQCSEQVAEQIRKQLRGYRYNKNGEFYRLPIRKAVWMVALIVDRSSPDGRSAERKKARLSVRKRIVTGFLKRGAGRYEEHDLEGAIFDCTTAIALDPVNIDAYSWRGDAMRDKGEFAAAIADYTRVITLDPGNADAYNRRGLAQYEKNNEDGERYEEKGGYWVDNEGNLEGAIMDFTSAIALDPENAEAYSNRCNARVMQGDWDGVIADSTEAIKLNPNDGDAYHNRGVAMGEKGDLAGGKEDLKRGEELGWGPWEPSQPVV